ncbi:Cytochrome P450 6B7 [Eumeta japonica]|uniref:unspecific monooxygenase n=1 Tax=Eumeta variegata TaxID=151549 RepID=A0A4C1WZR5_EUMVA|nr:Cytochrome P450 6B7 [Eumeta japonica]
MIVYAVSAILILFCTVYYWLKTKYSYWHKKNVVGPKPAPLVGTFGPVFLKKKSPGQLITEMYRRYPNEKYFGIYQGTKPALVLRDIKLIKQVMIKDFEQFQDRGFKISDREADQNLFSVEGDTWRVLRHRLTPIFTTGKLKTMIPLVLKSVHRLLEYTDEIVEKNVDHEIRSLASKYTLDVIGSCAFGVDVDAFSQKENIYREVADKMFQVGFKTRLFQILNALFPGIIKKLGLSLTEHELYVFFMNLVNKIIKEREGKPKVRKDFMDFMIELREEGRVIRKGDAGVAELEMNDIIITAQAMVFYAAGFETSSATMSFLLHEICQHQDIQKRIYEEVKDVIKKHGELSYEAIAEMKYLEMVFDETLRKHSVAEMLMRECGSGYTFSDTKLYLDKGLLVFIPVYAIHHDPKYYPDPEKFDPKRFSPENKSKIPSCAYLPFGDGPRNCIGMRFAKVQSMIGLAAFLNKFKVEASPKTKKTLEIDPTSITLASKDGIWVNIKRRY